MPASVVDVFDLRTCLILTTKLPGETVVQRREAAQEDHGGLGWEPGLPAGPLTP